MLILVCHSVLKRCELENNQTQIVLEVYYLFFNSEFYQALIYSKAFLELTIASVGK